MPTKVVHEGVSYDIQYARKTNYSTGLYIENDWHPYGCRENLKQARLLVAATIHKDIVMRIVRVDIVKHLVAVITR